MKIKKIYAAAAVLGLVIITWACQKEAKNANGANLNKPHSITVFLTDHQTPVFDSVFIDIQKLEVKMEDDSLPHGGWVNLTIRPGIYNILRFRNGLDTLFANGTLPNARISKIRFTLGTQNSVMKNGQSFPLNVHDNDREVIVNIDPVNFEIVAPDRVLFWIDFDAAGSIQVDNSGPGNNNGYKLKCHLKIFTQSTSGSIEGRVLPRAADPLVMAISGTDTTMAIPNHEDGEFKIVGLNAGTYRVFIDGQNGYLDTTINNVVVRNKEDSHIATVTLHQ